MLTTFLLPLPFYGNSELKLIWDRVINNKKQLGIKILNNLIELGAEEVEDVLDLDDEDIAGLQLKKLQTKRFQRAITKLKENPSS